METQRKILIIDDETDITDSVEALFKERHRVLKANDGEEGLQIARAQLPDLILLDISMPKLDGIAVCESLRSNEATRDIPIIMITGNNEPNHRIQAFTTGADDFLPKPFRLQELVARVNSKLRRIEEQKGQTEQLTCGNLVMNLSKMEVQVDQKAIPLSVLEFNLLKYLVVNKDRVLSREKILEAVWRETAVSDRTVDTHMVSLRKKLAGFDHTLSTIYGAGYILKKE